MPILRANALRSLQSSLRYSSARATARVAAPARTGLVAKRFASSGSGGHGAHESSSDIPWMIGAGVITPLTMWYLWPEAHDDHHAEHGHGEEHGSEEKEGEEDQSEEDQAPQEDAAPAEQSDDSEKDSGDDGKEERQVDPKDSSEEDKESEETAKPSGSQGEAQPNPKSSESADTTEEKEGAQDKENKSGVQFKGPMNEDSSGNIDERKSEPRPSKNSRVKRIDSGLGKNLGESEEDSATAKEHNPSLGHISNKQKGLSTTDTRHSEQIDQNPEKSKKGTGEPETAKSKGTIDPNAPVR